MILGSETSEHDANQMLHFYKQHFQTVEVVSCSKCSTALAFECSGGDGMGLAPNEIGKYIIPIGENLLSSRVRLDEAPTGERMMGYQCGAPVANPEYPAALKTHQAELEAYDKKYNAELKKARAAKKEEPLYQPPVMPNVPELIPCGNDTRIADVERGHVPVGPHQATLSPFEKHKIREEIAQSDHRADFKKVGNIKHFESFQVERV